jgi:hypothetical protein
LDGDTAKFNEKRMRKLLLPEDEPEVTWQEAGMVDFLQGRGRKIGSNSYNLFQTKK